MLVTSQNHQVDNNGEKPVRIIPCPAVIIQEAKLRKIVVIQEVIKLRSLGDLVGVLINFQEEVLSGPSNLSGLRSKSNHGF
ncbi:hypothetical protein Tco_0485560 [Tanacetum coccineum]